MNASASGGDSTPLHVVLGYDPWTYPQRAATWKDSAFVMFGCCMYEILQGTRILFGAKAKWRAGVFRAITGAFLLQSVTILCAMVVSGSKHLCGLYIMGPKEFFADNACAIIATIARLAYLYATMKTTLTVFEAKQTVRIVIYLTTTLATVSVICSGAITAHSLHLAYENYQTYLQTEKVDNEVITKAGQYTAIGMICQTITMALFNLTTKLLFIWQLFEYLDTPFYQAIQTMAKTKSTQRIFASTVWSFVEAAVMINQPTRNLTTSVVYFSVIFQITTLAMLTFQDSALIFQQHTTAGYLPTLAKSKDPTAVAQTVTAVQLQASRPLGDSVEVYYHK